MFWKTVHVAFSQGDFGTWKMALPKDVTLLRVFLGYVNNFHQYIPGFAELAASLQDTLKVPKSERKVYVFFSESEIADFEEIKKHASAKG